MLASRATRAPWLRAVRAPAVAPLRTPLRAPLRVAPVRQMSSGPQESRNRDFALYAVAVAVAVGGFSYAAVPLYKVFCQATGYGGTTQRATEEKFKTMKPVKGARPITVYFNADTADTMPWSFTPQQRFVKVVPGETALAFYTAKNPSDKPVTGVSTYNVTPMRAGVYFNKIQCFCFEEQRLRPREEIDMPIFFYIDPEFMDDPSMKNIETLTLSYTFFKTGEEDDYEPMPAKPEEAKAASERVKEWTKEVSEELGVQAKPPAAQE